MRRKLSSSRVSADAAASPTTHIMIQAFLQRLARWLDRPLFPWKKLVVGFSLAEFALENWLLFRQYRVLQRTIVPKALDKEIDQETFDKSQVSIT